MALALDFTIITRVHWQCDGNKKRCDNDGIRYGIWYAFVVKWLMITIVLVKVENECESEKSTHTQTHRNEYHSVTSPCRYITQQSKRKKYYKHSNAEQQSTQRRRQSNMVHVNRRFFCWYAYLAAKEYYVHSHNDKTKWIPWLRSWFHQSKYPSLCVSNGMKHFVSLAVAQWQMNVERRQEAWKWNAKPNYQPAAAAAFYL